MVNRQIKFRAWHPSKKIMFSPEQMGADQMTIMPDGQGFINVSGSHTWMSKLIPMLPLQFTGKSDLHNKEIFEGDILRATDETEFGDVNHYYVCVWINEWCIFAAVEYQEHENYIKDGASALDESMFWTFNIENGSDFTVCGNIYEHPDYIKNAHIEQEKTMNDVLGDADEVKD